MKMKNTNQKTNPSDNPINKPINKPVKKQKKVNANKLTYQIALFFSGIFVVMIVYLFYFEYKDADEVINSTYNKRQSILAEQTVRGQIKADNGEILAQTSVDESGNETRNYPYGNLFAHAVGYNCNGKAGVELYYNYKLLTSNSGLLELVINDLKGTKDTGDNVVTTLNVGLQKAASNSLGGYNGAAIAMDPETGKILCMVSKPDFDPNSIEYDWDYIVGNSENTNLLNRATNGVYPPGSTFKILTLLEYLHENPEAYKNYTFDCQGFLSVDDPTIKGGVSTIRCCNGAVHGLSILEDSFAYSCNSSFANIGLGLDKARFKKLYNSLLFNSKLPYNMTYSKSSCKLDEKSSVFETMQTCIGQGQTQVTPLHMCLIASAIANEGVLMKPYMVDHVENYEGRVVKTYDPEEYGQLLGKKDSEVLSHFMKTVVDYGTATQLQSSAYTAYGKTGTAQFDETVDNSHSLFVGYADNGAKKLAVCIVLEDMPSGGSAVPVARNIFDNYFG